MKLCVLIVVLMSSIALAPPGAAAGKKQKKPAAGTGAVAARVQPRPALASDPNSVYVGGEYIGRDPDPNIRAYMRKNPHDWDGPE